MDRRSFLQVAAIGAGAAVTGVREALAQQGASIEPLDRVFITNEDSNTISVR